MRSCLMIVLPLCIAGCFSYSSFSSPDLSASSLVLSAVNVPATAQGHATVTVTARRGNGTPLSGLTVSLTADKCTVVQPGAPSDANGQAVGSISSGAVGQHTVTATVAVDGFSAQLQSSGSINFYTPADGNTAVPLGGPLNGQVVAFNPDGSVNTAYTGTVHFTSSDPDATLPPDYTFSSKDQGSHIWVGTLILRTPGTQTVTATDVSTGQVINVETFYVAQPQLGEAVLQVADLPPTLVAGALSTIHVSALDASGHVVPSYLGTVTFSSSDSQASLPPSHAFTTDDNGVAAFAVTLKTAGTQWVAVSDGTFSSNQARATVNPNTAALLRVVGAVGGAAGSRNTVTVTAMDNYNNVATDYHGVVQFASSDANAVLPANTPLTAADSGSKTFTNGVTLVTAGTQSVSVWDMSDPNVAGRQAGLVITPAAAHALHLAGLSAQVQAGAAQSPRVTVVDNYNNTVTGFVGSVGFTSSDAGALLPPATAFGVGDQGVHTFANAVTFKSSGSQWLTVTASSDASVHGTLPAITVLAAEAVALSVSGLSATVDVGQSGSVAVTALDAYGNVAQTYSGTVMFGSSDSRATLPAASTFAGNDAGIKQFSNQVTFWTPGDQNVTVTDGNGIRGVLDVTAVKVVSLLGGLGYTSCAAFTNNALKCWGYNNEGELGLGDTLYRGVNVGQMGGALPVVDVGGTVTALSSGNQQSCALLQNGTVKCWGDNQYGELGLGDTVNRGSGAQQMGSALPAVALGTHRTAAAVATGSSQSCALLDDGSVKCWGSNARGELGLGDTTGRGTQSGQMGDNLPAVDLGGAQVLGLSGGYGHTCALLSGGAVKCWGYNVDGQLGLGDNHNRGDAPAEMGSSLPAVNLGSNRTALQIATGYYTTCARLDNGGVKCWGDNSYGELGLGDPTDRGYTSGQMGDALPAVNLGSSRTALTVVAGAFFVCALLDTHQVKCWGDNEYGNLGVGDTQNRGVSSNQMGDNLPAVSLGSGRTVQSLAAGQGHVCALLDNNQIKCWGYNSLGQLGLGDTSKRGSSAVQMGDALPNVVLW